MRRIPYIMIKDNVVNYVCPRCKRVITRQWYKEKDVCPFCNSYINRSAKTIMKVYRMLDEEFYEYFIQLSEVENG